MNIESATYMRNLEGEINRTIVVIVVDGKTLHVPVDNANTEYREIMRQVEAGTLTITDAE